METRDRHIVTCPECQTCWITTDTPDLDLETVGRDILFWHRHRQHH